MPKIIILNYEFLEGHQYKILENGCWLWLRGKGRGYGYLRDESGKHTLAHIFSYKKFKGEIAAGREVDHVCKNTLCVNPDHLEAVTHAVNVSRSNSFSAINARKTHCPKGHPYDKENTFVSNAGKRYCRICLNLKRKRHHRINHFVKVMARFKIK